jgi:hypothetical protein
LLVRAIRAPHRAIVNWDFENRLELARRMGYPCGGVGETPPHPGAWFTKPLKNPAGMGVGARRNAYVAGPSPGWARPMDEDAMWMPVFRGEHLSVDFQRGRGGAWRQRLTVRCEYDTGRARPAQWHVERRTFAVPEPLRGIDSEWLNVELIGGRVIEAHRRRNTDFDNAPPAAQVARVVWADECRAGEVVSDFDDADGHLAIPRVGFVYR